MSGFRLKHLHLPDWVKSQRPRAVALACDKLSSSAYFQLDIRKTLRSAKMLLPFYSRHEPWAFLFVAAYPWFGVIEVRQQFATELDYESEANGTKRKQAGEPASWVDRHLTFGSCTMLFRHESYHSFSSLWMTKKRSQQHECTNNWCCAGSSRFQGSCSFAVTLLSLIYSHCNFCVWQEQLRQGQSPFQSLPVAMW